MPPDTADRPSDYSIALRFSFVASFFAAYLVLGSILYFNATGRLGDPLDLSFFELDVPPRRILLIDVDSDSMDILASCGGGLKNIRIPINDLVELQQLSSDIEIGEDKVRCFARRTLADGADPVFVEAAAASLHDTP